MHDGNTSIAGGALVITTLLVPRHPSTETVYGHMKGLQQGAPTTLGSDRKLKPSQAKVEGISPEVVELQPQIRTPCLIDEIQIPPGRFKGLVTLTLP